MLIVATYNRGTWVGAVVVLLVIGALRKRVLLILVPLVAIIAVAIVPSISLRLAGSLSEGGSFADRVSIWQTTLPEWIAETRDDAGAVSTTVNRFVGMGPGGGEVMVLRARGGVNAVHDDYLAVLYEYGILGLVAYLSIYLAILLSAYRTWRRCTDERVASVVLSFLALIPSLMVMSITSNIFGQTQNQVYFWTLAGLTVAIGRLAVRTEGNLSLAGRVEGAPSRNDREPVYAPPVPRLSP
jgi:O-antigen ligase